MSLEKVSFGWQLTGNASTDTTINFLGTRDPIDFIIKTNNLERLRVASDGNIGINKSDPSEILDIVESISSTAVIRLQHTASNNDARLEIRTSGGGDADPFIRLAIDGATTWSLGVDDSDDDAFKIANFTSPGNNARIKIEKDGKVFINRNLEVGSTQTEDEVQVQILAGAAQSANILQIGENGGGALDKFFVVDEVGRIGIGVSVNPSARLDVQGSIDEIQALIKGNSTQTGNVFEVQDSVATKVFVVDKTGRLGIKKATPTELIDIEESAPGNAVIKLAHVVSGLSNNVTLKLQTEGSGGGDPRIKFNIKGVADGTWNIGIDNSDLDSFKISRGSNLESNTRIKIDQGGKVFINRNVEIGPAALTEVQFQLLSKPSQSANIMQVGEDAGDLDGFFVMDEVGNVGIGDSIDPAAKLHVKGSVLFTDEFKHTGSTFGIFNTTPVIQAPAYTPTNVTTDRSYDADITTLNELADIVGTMIADLKTYGIFQ